MTTSIAKAGLRLVAGCSLALLVAASGAAFANSGRNGGGPAGFGEVHGPGSSHNPIVYHPVHGPGSSHNPIIASKPGNGLAPGTVVRDHRRGKNCSYVVGNGGLISASTCPRGPRPRPCSRTRTRNCIPAIPSAAIVHDHRTPSTPQCYGDLC